ncbi:hypothetical protein K438DRAFT_1597420, partial [Mycena galopus ATCC 62051]
LAPRAAIHISPFVLGAMAFNETANPTMGAMDKELGFKLLNAFFDVGTVPRSECCPPYSMSNGVFTAETYRCIRSHGWSRQRSSSVHSSLRGPRDAAYGRCTGFAQVSFAPYSASTHFLYGGNALRYFTSICASSARCRTSKTRNSH